MFGDEKNEARALNLWLKLALQFDCLENKCSAFMALAKHFGMKESFKVKLIELVSYVESGRLKKKNIRPKIDHMAKYIKNCKSN